MKHTTAAKILSPLPLRRKYSGNKKAKLYSMVCEFLKKKQNIETLYCDNGLFKISLTVKVKPQYFMYSVFQYNATRKKFEAAHSYGSPFAADVINALNFEVANQ